MDERLWCNNWTVPQILGKLVWNLKLSYQNINILIVDLYKRTKNQLLFWFSCVHLSKSFWTDLFALILQKKKKFISNIYKLIMCLITSALSLLCDLLYCSNIYWNVFVNNDWFLFCTCSWDTIYGHAKVHSAIYHLNVFCIWTFKSPLCIVFVCHVRRGLQWKIDK